MWDCRKRSISTKIKTKNKIEEYSGIHNKKTAFLPKYLEINNKHEWKQHR